MAAGCKLVPGVIIKTESTVPRNWHCLQSGIGRRLESGKQVNEAYRRRSFGRMIYAAREEKRDEHLSDL